MNVLILCPSEICYNPRLLKAADYLHARGCTVTVYNAVTGLASQAVYDSVKQSRTWRIVENDITKRSPKARRRWLYSSLVHKLAGMLYKTFHLSWCFAHVMTKSYVLFPAWLKKERFDFILIHLVDTLPFAVQLSGKTGGRIIYDSQEYFKGQYQHADPLRKSWVYRAEDLYAPQTDIVLATTRVMLLKLQQEITGPRSFLRVRNTPVKKQVEHKDTASTTLKMVWHGLTIVPQNIRGVHILLQAVAVCKAPVQLYLQGNITPANGEKLTALVSQLGITDKVFVLPSANPDHIVESLQGYDIGAVGELAAEDNQRLTSSNKLFEFINAGLAVLVPDLPGLAETVTEYQVGMLYEQGSSKDLANRIDMLHHDRESLQRFKVAARKAAETELYWEYDYGYVWEKMQDVSK